VIELVPIGTVNAAAVEDLLDRAFGPDRHARTAYKVRGTASAVPELSFAAIEGAVLVGSIQCWPVSFLDDAGRRTDLVMVGPVAVYPARQGDGIGRALVARALAAAGDEQPLLLIGDPEYYGRFFGFDAARTGSWRLPGPVERHRLLARGAGVPAGAGQLGPALTAPVPAT
jgi:predicted N-acetyltransferase YhbS